MRQPIPATIALESIVAVLQERALRVAQPDFAGHNAAEEADMLERVLQMAAQAMPAPQAVMPAPHASQQREALGRFIFVNDACAAAQRRLTAAKLALGGQPVADDADSGASSDNFDDDDAAAPIM